MSELKDDAIYCAIAHGKTILCQHDFAKRDPKEVVQLVLAKIAPGESKKASLMYQDLSIHYISTPATSETPEGVTFILITKESCGRKAPFLCLLEMEKKFNQQYSPQAVGAAQKDGLNKFEGEMVALVNSGKYEDVAKVAQSEINKVRDIMVENVEQILERGERISLLVNRTDEMTNNAVAFRKRSTQAKRNMWWQNVKMTALLGTGIAGFIYILIGSVCGFGFQCV
ncbi:Vesicle-associated membrane protein 714 [Yarrowia sp. B02]|nr:Vesicle-associated membrane protein 714 [Yarrowia sp. B02]